MKYRLSRKKNFSILLSLLIVVGLLFQIGLGQSELAIEKRDSTLAYYENEVENFDDWELICALYGAGYDVDDELWSSLEWDTSTFPLEASASHYGSRILALLALEKDPTNIWERNLVLELIAKQQEEGSFGTFLDQIYAMLALDAVAAEYDEAAALTWLLSNQNDNGGFGFSAGVSDLDTTGMTLIVLANYREQPEVEEAIQKVLSYIHSQQLPSAGFASWGDENSNSIARVISGLVAIGEDIYSEAWQQNGQTMFDALLNFELSDHSYSWQLEPKEYNGYSTKQVFMALGDLAAGNSVFNRLSYQQKTMDIEIRIEGIEETLLDETVRVAEVNGTVPTVQTALETALTEHQIEHVIAESSYGPYLSSIAGESAGSFGGYDGWLYLKNGQAAGGIGTETVSDGDELVFYYGDMAPGTLIPTVEVIPEEIYVGDDITFKVTSTYDEYDENFQATPVTVAVAGAQISIGEQTYVTGADGTVTIVGGLPEAGSYDYRVTKDSADQVPGLVRTSDLSFTVKPLITEYKNVHLRIEGITETLLNSEVAVPYVKDVNPTVQTALETALTEHQIEHVIAESSYGPYLSSIAGESAGSFGGYDGWLYLKNGQAAGGIGTETVSDGDELLFYYGETAPITLVPTISYTPEQPKVGEQIVVQVTSTYEAYDEDYNATPVTVKVEGATVLYKGQEYTTDQDGCAVLPVIELPGTEMFKVYKQAVGQVPALVRTAAYTFTAEFADEAQTISSDEVLNLERPTSIVVDSSVEMPRIAGSTAVEANALVATFPAVCMEAVTDKGTVTMQIPHDTMITGPLNWDGQIQLPTVKETSSVNLGSTKEAKLVITAGSSGQDLIFSKPIRLVMPGQASRQVLFIDGEGKQHLITTHLNSDSLEEALTLPEGGEGYIEVGEDLVIWTKHFTTFVTYQKVATGGSSSSSDYVKISVKGDPSRGTILASTRVTIKSNDTVLDVLLEAMDNDVQYSGSGSSAYIESIAGLAEFDYGPLSGWVYKVNGVYPEMSAGAYRVKDKDVISFIYTLGEEDDDDTDSGTSQEADNPQEEDNSTEIVPQLNEKVAEAVDNIKLYTKKAGLIDDWILFDLALASEDISPATIADFEKSIINNIDKVRKGTYVERWIIAAKALGLDPTNIQENNLIEVLLNFASLENQGSNSLIFALIALNTGDYELPGAPLWTEELLLSKLLTYQNGDGGFTLVPDEASAVDLTAMALQALAPYQEKVEVKEAVAKALAYLKQQQLPSAGFAAEGEENVESTAQVIMALTSLGIDPLDVEFRQEENNLIDNLLSYQLADGSFEHTKLSGSNNMATEHALRALLAYQRYKQGLASIYDLAQKNLSFATGMLYNDDELISNWSRGVVYEARQLGIIDGEANTFRPQAALTRAELAVILLNVLGEEVQPGLATAFNDIEPNYAYYAAITTAEHLGLVSGVPVNRYAPEEVVNREQLATVLARTFELKQEKEYLPFKDDEDISAWARESVSRVVQAKLLAGYNGWFNPKQPVTREMAAAVMMRLLDFRVSRAQ